MVHFGIHWRWIICCTAVLGLASCCRRSNCLVSVARRWQFTSHHCLFQITCQLKDRNHWAQDSVIKKVVYNLPALCHNQPQVWFIVCGPVISFSLDPLINLRTLFYSRKLVVWCVLTLWTFAWVVIILICGSYSANLNFRQSNHVIKVKITLEQAMKARWGAEL
jgi:hypothetical protein